MEVVITKPGLLTTVQDLGRRGYRFEGVALGGAVDPFALRMANLLVGNAENTAALEVTLVGPDLDFPDTALVAVTGAEFDGIPAWRPFVVPAGDRLRFGPAKKGCRGYIAISGGIDVLPVIGGRGTHLSGGFGGWEGRALRAGDHLPVGHDARQASERWTIDRRVIPEYSASPVVRVLRGAQADTFGTGLYEGPFKVSVQSDRMGMRLTGRKLEGDAGDLISSAVAPGTIQVPPDGAPIILLADAQTLGGYPQVAHAATVDLPLLAQLKPGDSVRFQEISLDEAHALSLARERSVALIKQGLAEKFH
jgi:antagonist of KipI